MKLVSRTGISRGALLTGATRVGVGVGRAETELLVVVEAGAKGVGGQIFSNR